MTTVIINKEKDGVKVYSDRLYQCKNIETGEFEPENDYHDIKAIKINEDMILFSTGNMMPFRILIDGWRRNPDYIKKFTSKEILISELKTVLQEYAKINPSKALINFYIVTKKEVLFLDFGLNYNYPCDVDLIVKPHKISGIPQIYGQGSRVFKKPAKLSKLLKSGVGKVFEKLNRDSENGTSKEFDVLTILK